MSNRHDALTISEARSLRFLFCGQFLHLTAAVILTAIAWALAAPVLTEGSWLGISDVGWFWAAVGLTILHQFYVWVVFRGQLGWGLFTRLFGRYDLTVHSILFSPMLIARPLVVIAAGLANPLTLALPRWVQLAIGLALLVPPLYTGWSVKQYFGFKRAVGGDHFRRRYREMPLVTEGAFSWTPNAMYTFAFFGLWSIALLLGSHLALVIALFQHAFIWAHHFGTEQPDMELIYGE
jgi:protein-S-isoprenylcysteine O-methyltransferase Ste14